MKKKATCKVECAFDKMVDTAALIPNPRNPNKHPQKQLDLLAKIIKAQGWRNAIVVSNLSGFVTKGHARLDAAKILGCEQVPVDFQDYDTPESEMADMLADNRLSELAEPDLPMLKDILLELDTGAFDMDLTGFDTESIESLMTQLHEPEETEHKSLSERFIVPPFSVLDARQGYWQERKRAWLALGIQSELGRGGQSER